MKNIFEKGWAAAGGIDVGGVRGRTQGTERWRGH